ncbi:MAG: glycoside hydrolase family 25 protein [Lachnospiraceae bacterium]|nr:glycoside hydrolase family 25 protein [Lachnospiraceae bacterium]
MDSRLKWTAILSSLAAILVVALAVYATNGQQRSLTGSGEQKTATVGVDGQQQTQPDEGAAQSAAPRKDGQIGNDLKAFEQEDGFFDPERNPVLEAAKDKSSRLSLMVTSVEKDLRIQIVDNEGEPVTGNSFYVELARAQEDGTETAEVSQKDGSYKDLDKDGVIYIGDLESGEYLVRLAPAAGFKVPASETRVKVKDKVEFLPIDDILLLIKNESEIDAQAEDSGERDALSDADQTEMTDLKAFSGKTKTGIDVSKWNGVIDWDKAKNAGVQFAIVRAGYRGSVTGSLVQDICFEANMRGAAAAGVPVGIYFFTQATNEVEAVEEASATLAWIKQYEITYPIFIDTEGAGGGGRADGLDVDTRTLVCEAFCRTIENAGYQAGVYASRNWYDHNLHTRKLENYYIWLAEYRSVPLYQGYYRMWQYSSKGHIDGIEGNVDMNIMYE